MHDMTFADSGIKASDNLFMNPQRLNLGNSADGKGPPRQEAEALQLKLGECQRRLEQMDSLFSQLADGVFVASPDGRIIDVNPAACELLGYSKAELLSMHPWDFVMSASREDILSLINGMQTGTPVTIQRTYRSKSGAQKIMDLRLSRCDVAGRDLVIVSCRDVTEQQRLEARLRRSEKNLAEGQRLTKTGSWILDFKTGNTDWSVETCRIFGFPDPPPSPHYNEFRARVRPEDREGVDRGLRESFETGEPRPLEYVFILPDGTRKNIETISQRVRDDEGELKLIGTVMDVTERIQAAEALRFSEHLARGQLEALQQALVSLSQESEPGKFLEHVLCITGRQLGAHSISVWEMNEKVGCVDLLAVYEDGRLQVHSGGGQARPQLHFEAQTHPVWTEFFRTGERCVYGEINTDPPGAHVATDPNGPWFDWLGSAVANANAPSMINRLAASGIAAMLCIPMIISGKVTGMFSIRFKQKRLFRKEELELTRAMAHQAMLAIQLMRLSEQSRETAVMAERNRLARDMHDTLAQGFTGVIMQLEAAKGATAHGNIAEVADRIERAGELARESLGEARRSVRALRPRSLRDGKLSLALEDLLKRMTDGGDLSAEFKAEGDERTIPFDSEEMLLRVTQESLTNTVKHANARNFKATLSVSAERIQLQLVDDGVGFDPQVEHEGFGLIGMKERVDQLGGQFIIRSKPGVGTEILVVLKNQSPLHKENANEQI